MVIFQFNSKFNPEVYAIPYKIRINVPNFKKFHVGKYLCNPFYSCAPYKNYCFNFSTTFGFSSSNFSLVYLAFELWITRELAGVCKLTLLWSWMELLIFRLVVYMNGNQFASESRNGIAVLWWIFQNHSKSTNLICTCPDPEYLPMTSCCINLPILWMTILHYSMIGWLLGAPPSCLNSVQQNVRLCLSQKVKRLYSVLIMGSWFSPLYLNGTPIEAIDCIKYLGIRIWYSLWSFLDSIHSI